ncbi:hypothetical protein FJY94_00170 [Candidatus Kaiserbacteria bacterium]|nr:hypothetical protein [Candidatus Kaiserbacteria bacterium]
MKALAAVTGLASLLVSGIAYAEDIGSVSTSLNLLTPNDQIVVEVFDDPAVKGVSCYLSRARTGGAAAIFGMAEDKSDSSVACRQVGPISFVRPVAQQEQVFSEHASILFKRTHVIRMVDKKRGVLVYLVYTDELIDGSPKNALTAVPVSSDITIPTKG